MTQRHSLRARYARRRFGVLFGTLLVVLVGHPLLELIAPEETVSAWLLVLSLIAAVLGVERERGVRPLLAVIVLCTAFRAASGALGSAELFEIGQLLAALAALLSAALLVRHALRRGPVDSERIFAALDAYLLVAVACGALYWVLDRIWPASIGPDVVGTLHASDAMYLSLVTISTVGYGDLVPVTPLARGLATLEAIGGQMYLVVLVARLVTLYVDKGAAQD